MTFGHGLVVGKFYPPHLGHLSLIRAAADACERVTVVVAASSVETLSLADRVEWLGWDLADRPHVTVVGVMDDHPVDYYDPEIWDAHMVVFEAAIAEVAPGAPVDAVFSGESYGDELARRLAARHLRVERPGTSPSGTAARADLIGRWMSLIPSARVALARRIAVVGAESTGTTTLAFDLADALGAAAVPEYGRVYSGAKLAGARQMAGSTSCGWMESLTWRSEEFTAIAARQQAAIDAAALSVPVVVADTDALATSIWHDRYVGGPHLPSLELARVHPPALYLLTSHVGIEFEQDGLRDGEHLRASMTDTFRQALERQPVAWVEMTGDRFSRLDAAVRACRDAARLPELAEPLG